MTNMMPPLFDEMPVSLILDFNIEDFQHAGEIIDSMHRISVSGVQEKFPAIIKDGKIRIASQNERSTHILKPAPWDMTIRDRKLMPANEHLTMQIAAQVYGIQTAKNGLCFMPDGHPVYITRRFDILSSRAKIQMEDFASVINRSEQIGGSHFKYEGSYEDIALAIRANIGVWMVDMERFFELVVFNYIYANGDAHLKNFSLIFDGKGLRLAPAYDLLNTAVHIDGDDFALDNGLSPDLEKSDAYYRTGHPCRLDFESFGTKIGLKSTRINKILNKYTAIPDSALQFIAESLLPHKAQRNYLRIISERTARFNRQ